MRDIRKEILDAADRCFYEAGITATGVDRLAETAGVSKRTIYTHFGSKEGVVAAYLEQREARWRGRLPDGLDPEADPVERLIQYLNHYMLCEDPNGTRGCAFINASAELADTSHPGVAIIQSSIDRVTDDIIAILSEAGVSDPGDMAEELLVVFEGAMSVSGIRRNDDAGRVAERLIRRLLPVEAASQTG